MIHLEASYPIESMGTEKKGLIVKLKLTSWPKGRAVGHSALSSTAIPANALHLSLEAGALLARSTYSWRQ